jgi:hypothetical protein
MNNFWTFGDSFTAGHGCKFTENWPFSIKQTDSYYYKTYHNYYNANKKIWPEIVSDYLNLNLINCGENGISNQTIFDLLMVNLDKFKEGDIVIVQTSVSGRFDFPFAKEKTLFGFKNYSLENDTFETIESPYRFKTIFTSNIFEEYSENNENMLFYTNGQESLNDPNVKLNKVKYDNIRNFFLEFVSTGKFYERDIWRFIKFIDIFNKLNLKIYLINEGKWPMYLKKPKYLINVGDDGMHGYTLSNKKTIFHDTNGKIDDKHPSYGGHEILADLIINFIKNENTNIHKS